MYVSEENKIKIKKFKERKKIINEIILKNESNLFFNLSPIAFLAFLKSVLTNGAQCSLAQPPEG